jgi:hypothetical protein
MVGWWVPGIRRGEDIGEVEENREAKNQWERWRGGQYGCLCGVKPRRRWG